MPHQSLNSTSSFRRSYSPARSYRTPGWFVLRILMALSLLASYLAPVTARAASAPAVRQGPAVLPAASPTEEWLTPVQALLRDVGATAPASGAAPRAVNAPTAPVAAASLPSSNEGPKEDALNRDTSAIGARLETQIASDWSLVGNASNTAIPGAIRLTEPWPERRKKGAAWKKQQVDLSQDFDRSFMVYLGVDSHEGNIERGADGIVFAFQQKGLNAIGSDGEAMGYYGIDDRHLLGIQIDTFNNGSHDKSEGHIAIVFHDGHNNEPSSYILGSSATEDGREHLFRVNWDVDTHTLAGYWDGVQVVTYTNDIVQYVFNNNGKVWYGLTAGTGDATNLQYFRELPIPEQSSLNSGDDLCFNVAYNEANGIVAEPINTRTGGYDYSVEDLSIPTSAGPLTFRRTYSSLATDLYTPLATAFYTTSAYTNTSGFLGYGWAHSLDTRLVFSNTAGGMPGMVLFKAQTANRYLFYDKGNGTYDAYPGLCASLKRQGSAPNYTYQLIDGAQRRYAFDHHGLITEVRTPQGHAWHYDYYPVGWLQRVRDDSGTRYLQFSYDSRGRITRVVDHTGRQVDFAYSPSTGDLITATDVLAHNWTYAYTDTHRLRQVTDPRGKIVERTEYEQGKAVRQYDGMNNLVAALTYNSGGSTIVSEGGYTSTHTYDSRHTLTRQENTEGGVGKVYDGNFRPVSVTDPLSHTTKLRWSGDGENLEMFAAGGYTTTLHYDGLNNLTSTIDGRGNQVAYTYVVSSTLLPGGTLLRSSTDAEGGTSVYTYTTTADAPQPAGLLKEMKDPNGNVTRYTYNQYGERITAIDALNRTTTYEYDNLGRLKKVTYPGSQRTDWTCYDNAGRVWRTVQNATGTEPCNPDYARSTDANKGRIRDTYYDLSGNAAASIDWMVVAGTVITRATRTYYDNANRPVKVVRNLTGDYRSDTLPPESQPGSDHDVTSETVYDNVGRLIVSIEWVVDGVQAVSRTTRIWYDDLGRPYTITQNFVGSLELSEPPAYNPAYPDRNVTTQNSYDAAGKLTTTEDALGHKTRTFYDELNRPYLVFQNWVAPADGPEDCNREEGAATNICTETSYDGNGNVIATQDAKGVWTRTYYDKANRPFLIAQNVDVSSILTDTLPTCNSTPGADSYLCTRTVYDKSGNVIASIDPLGHVTRTYYEANQPVLVVRNLTGHDYALGTPPDLDDFGNEQNVATGTVYDAHGRAIAAREWVVEGGQLITHTTRTYYDTFDRPYLLVRNLDPAHDLYDDDDPPVCNRNTWQNGQPNYYNLCSETKYDPNTGQAIASIDPLGRVTRTYYDALQRPYLVVRNLTVQAYTLDTPPTDSNFGNDENVAVKTVYDSRGQAIARIEYWREGSQVISRTERTWYDALGRATSVVRNFTGSLGAASPLVYDPAYPDRNVRVDAAYAPDGNAIASIEWLAEGTQVFTRTARTYYDGLGRATLTVQNLNPTWGYNNPTPPACNRDAEGDDAPYNVCSQVDYNAAGEVITRTDALGHITTFEYDDLGRLAQESDPLDRISEYTYDVTGNRIQSENAKGVATLFDYDGLGRLEAVVENYQPGADPDEQTNVRTEYVYDAMGNRLAITDALTHTTTFGYNALGWPIQEVDPLSNTWLYTYDAAGRRTGQTDANGAAIAYVSDGLGRVKQIDYPAPEADVIFAFNALGWRTAMTDTLGVTRWRYDLLGRPLTITHPVSGTVGYRYDAQGNRTALIYPDGKRVDYSYDRLGRLKNVTDWYSKVVTYTYNVAGSLVKAELPNGAISTYEYDDAGQLLHLMHMKDGPAIPWFSSRYDYLYDSVGNRRMVTETLFTPYLTYFPWEANSGDEGSGQLLMAAPGAAEALSSGDLSDPYPAVEGETPGLLSPLATPLPVEEAYPLPESDPPAMDSLDSAYPAPVDGAEGGGTSFWEGIVAFFSNLFGWLSPASTAHAAPAQASVAVPVQATILNGGEQRVVITYTYDSLNRLTAADYHNGMYFHYAYDPVGNRLSQTTPAGTTNFSYDDANRLDNDGAYTWDANGNLLNDGVYTYTYSAANRLLSVSGGQSPAVDYSYNGLGDRVQQTSGGVTTNYAIDLAGGLTQVLADGQRTYLYGNGRVAQYGAGSVDYFLGDALGSVRQLVDGSGNVTLVKRYEPYGEEIAHEGTASSIYGYTGEITDPTGLVYLRARYYAPWQGRFISRDAWEGDYSRPITFNRWHYAHDNPVNFTDPSGRDPITTCLAILGVVSVADGPSPIGDGVGIVACIALLGTAGISAIISAQYADDLGTAVETTVDRCKKITWEELSYQQTQPERVPWIPPLPQQPPIDTPESSSMVITYRELDGDLSSDKSYFKKPITSPSQFREDEDGVSTFEMTDLPGIKPYALGFKVKVKTPIVQGATGLIIDIPICAAIFTPTMDGRKHWSVNCIGYSTKETLSLYAKATRTSWATQNDLSG